MGTSVARTASYQEIWKLGLGYEMPCGPVDGMDPVAVAKEVDKAIQSSVLERALLFRNENLSIPRPFHVRCTALQNKS